VQGFTIAGHVAIDHIIYSEREFTQLGGPPSYSAVLGGTLGFPVEVVTKIGYDFPEKLVLVIHSMGINDQDRSESPSTRFVLDYRFNPRRMRVPTVCQPILLSEVKDAERILLCPITREINDKLIEDLDPEFLGLDPQGLVRDIKHDHSVSLKSWCNQDALRKINLLKTSSNEHQLITGTMDIKKSLQYFNKKGVEIAVITDGNNGSYVMTDSDFFRVPVYNVDLVDSTGAGDVFIAGLASHLDEGLLWACAVASASSSAIVETRGPEIRCSRREILERAKIIFDNIEELS